MKTDVSRDHPVRPSTPNPQPSPSPTAEEIRCDLCGEPVVTDRHRCGSGIPAAARELAMAGAR